MNGSRVTTVMSTRVTEVIEVWEVLHMRHILKLELIGLGAGADDSERKKRLKEKNPARATSECQGHGQM